MPIQELETFRITINEEDEGVDFISFVDNPAIKKGFVAFSENLKVYFNEELRIITTPVLIPNQKIYRNQDGREFNLIALESDVEKIYNKFVKDANFNKLNLMHQEGTELSTNDAHLIEIFLSDKRRGISNPTSFENLPNMTWFVSYKITSDKLWDDIKNGTFKGVSLEGNLGIMDFDKEEDQVETLLTELKTNIKMSTKKIIVSLTEMVNGLKKDFKLEEEVAEVLEIKEATLTDGTIIQYDKLEVGGVVMAITEEGEVPAPDATHELEDGTLITTVDGIITAIVEGKEEVAEEDAEAEMFSEFKAMIEKLGLDFQEAVASHKEEIKTLKTELAEYKEQVSVSLGEVKEAVSVASKMPAANPAKRPRLNTAKGFKQALKAN